MGYVAKLIKGAALLDLSSGRYALMGDFIPPSTSFDIATAGGTSANRYGGATKVIEKALPIDLTFSVRVLGGSNAEIERGVKDIANFLRQAGDANEPVYLEWRPDSNVAFEPAWGQQGSNLRLRV